jgi:aminopeptidase
MPLSYKGELIEDFSVTFKDGKVSAVSAKRNQNLLEQMIAMDEGAKMLGEVALVPFESPIRQSGVLFYNTLFDENAACHLALGRGFSNAIKNYDKYTKEDFARLGVNESMIHVDFMIGTKNLPSPDLAVMDVKSRFSNTAVGHFNQ